MGDFPAAEKTLLKVIERFPSQDANYNALSQLHVIYSGKLRAEGKAAEAGQELTNALKVIEGQRKAQPQNPSVHFNYGNLLMFVND
jgi:hypothetical protein